MFDDAFMGTIALTTYQYAPYGWENCMGQSLNQSQYPAIFAIIGTLYGSSQQGWFNLPNLQGYLPMGFGQGPGLMNYAIGSKTGVEATALSPSQLPVHTHTANVTNTITSAAPTATVTNGLTLSVTVNALAVDGSGTSDVGGPNLGLASPPGVAPSLSLNKPKIYGPAGSTPLAGVSPVMTGAPTATVSIPQTPVSSTLAIANAGGMPGGGTQSFGLVQPSLVLRPIFCIDGIFPVQP